NNVRATAQTTRVQLTPPPDLEVMFVDAPATATAGFGLTVNYRVANNGLTATPNAYWRDAFYLSPTPTFNPATALLLGSRPPQGALDAGASYSDAPTFTLPNSLSGSFYAFVITDVDDVVFEVNNTNNRGSDPQPVLVSSRPADLVVQALRAPANA